MKFSLKTIAAAVVMAAAASGASAAIDNGALGNGELFFNIWDANGSYSRSLETSIDSFQGLLAATGSLDLSFAADTTFTSFLAGANAASLKWNVQAVDTSGARRILETYSSMPATTKTNDIMRSTAGAVQAFATAINGQLLGNDSVAVGSASAAYAGKTIYGDTFSNTLNFSNAGTLGNNSFASGLNFMRIDALSGGTAKSIYTQYADTSSAVSVYLDANKTLHIAAMPVPEPESYAMLLAGLGMLGFMARRRLNNRV